jgi:hypothetical protein
VDEAKKECLLFLMLLRVELIQVDRYIYLYVYSCLSAVLVRVLMLEVICLLNLL